MGRLVGGRGLSCISQLVLGSPDLGVWGIVRP